jgi:hypothetical protein
VGNQGYSYYGRFAQFACGNEYQIIVRKGTREEVILDLKDIAWLKPYQKTVRLVKTTLSDNHERLLVAYGLDLKGDERTVW